MERSLALDVAYLGVAEPGDGVAGTEFTQCVDVDTVTFNFSDAKELSFTSMGHEDPWAVVSRFQYRVHYPFSYERRDENVLRGNRFR